MTSLAAAIETGIEDIVVLVRNLDISHDVSQERGQEHLYSTCGHTVSLQGAIHGLIQSTNPILSEAQSIKYLADDANSSGYLPLTEVCSLHEGIKNLTSFTFNLQSTISALNEATERSVIIHLKSLASQSETTLFKRPLIQNLFSHFDKQIRNIVRGVLNTTSDQNVLWKVAEECYKQANSPSGILHADDYFIPLEEARLQWPDPDFESEEYYEHENRFDVDEDYAASFRLRTELRDQSSSKDRQDWISFWIRVLNNAPAGPTLFYPPASFSNRSLNLDAVPQYLFRTFDGASSGRNDESVIASMASIAGSQESSRFDLLALERHKAAKQLHMHLTKDCFGGEESDNLMSWTSSLLFAIQYAVWRHRWRPWSDIKICAVDTNNFPRGQFVRDTWLINAYESAVKQDDSVQKFFQFRLKNEDFYNGEYLSQGTINHTGRSCVVSLEQLIQAGLFQLYPEFENAKGSERWAKRALELRQIWSVEQRTTDQEIQLALQVARICFTLFDRFNVASILLTFKNRKYSRLTPTNNPNLSSKQRPEWADKPDEVRRYWIATEAANSYNKLPHAQLSHVIQQYPEMLREIFD